jgi:hypothetical protein
MSALPKSANTSCAECWMEFEDETSLLEHVKEQHPFAYALPPYRNTEPDMTPESRVSTTEGA